MLWRKAHSQEWLCYKSLDAEGAAAAAGALDVGVVELEAGAFEGLDVVDFHSLKVHGAHLVDGNLQAVEIHDFIGVVGLVFKRHVVLKTGAAATDDSDTQRHRHRRLHGHDFLHFYGGSGREINHNSYGLHSRNLPQG